jgi:hypothetical protein
MLGTPKRRLLVAAVVIAVAAGSVLAAAGGDGPCADSEPLRATALLRDRAYVIASPRPGESVRLPGLPGGLRDHNTAGVGPDEEDAVVVTAWTSTEERVDQRDLLANFSREQPGARPVELAGDEGRIVMLSNSALAIGTIGDCGLAAVHGPNEELVRSVARDLRPPG